MGFRLLPPVPPNPSSTRPGSGLCGGIVDVRGRGATGEHDFRDTLPDIEQLGTIAVGSDGRLFVMDVTWKTVLLMRQPSSSLRYSST